MSRNCPKSALREYNNIQPTSYYGNDIDFKDAMSAKYNFDATENNVFLEVYKTRGSADKGYTRHALHFSIDGYSIAGESTCIVVSFGKNKPIFVFDIGCDISKKLINNFMNQNLAGFFISHAHIDHIGGLPKIMLNLFNRRYNKKPNEMIPPVPIYVPSSYTIKHVDFPECKEEISSIIDSVRSLQGASKTGNASVFQGIYNTFGLDGNDDKTYPTIVQKSKNDAFMIKRFKTCHTAPSQGYLIYEKTKTQSSETYEPIVAFTGDTEIGFLNLKENAGIINDVLRAPVLIMEMTYIKADHEPNAAAYGHMHLDHFINDFDRFNNERIIFIHLSRRCGSATEIVSLLNTKLDPLKEKMKKKNMDIQPLLVGF